MVKVIDEGEPRCSHGNRLYNDAGEYTKPECGCPGDAHLPEISEAAKRKLIERINAGS